MDKIFLILIAAGHNITQGSLLYKFERVKMDMGKFVSRWILVTGIIIALIGVVHSSFAPMMYQQMMKDEAVKDKAKGFIYFFAFDGFAVVFAGLLTVFSSFGLKKSEKWAWIIALSSGLFITLGGIGAVAFAKFTNPMIYAMGISAVTNVFVSVHAVLAKQGVVFINDGTGTPFK